MKALFDEDLGALRPGQTNSACNPAGSVTVRTLESEMGVLGGGRNPCG